VFSTDPTAIPVTTVTATSTPSGMPNNVRIGAIAGGAVGGVALATVIGYLVYHALLAYSFDAI